MRGSNAQNGEFLCVANVSCTQFFCMLSGAPLIAFHSIDDYFMTSSGMCESCAGDASKGLVAITTTVIVVLLCFGFFVRYGSGQLQQKLKTIFVAYYSTAFDMAKFKIV